MEAKELRIGNYVNYGIKGAEVAIELTKIYKDSIVVEFSNPIPLTEEWLLKFGFNDCIINNSSLINCYEMDIKNKCFYLISDSKNRVTISRDLKYVHQLQNLYFSLTQTELTLS